MNNYLQILFILSFIFFAQKLLPWFNYQIMASVS